MKQIIGLGYKARSGKDTVADYLVRKYDFQKVAFADSLKEACRVIFGLSTDQLYGNSKDEWDFFWKDTPRNILQLVGTECLRKGYSESVWIRSLQRKIEDSSFQRFVISDVRFPNEAEAIKSWGGCVWKIDRESRNIIVTNQHTSETAMDEYKGWNSIISNEDTIDHLYQQIDRRMLK